MLCCAPKGVTDWVGVLCCAPNGGTDWVLFAAGCGNLLYRDGGAIAGGVGRVLSGNTGVGVRLLEGSDDEWVGFVVELGGKDEEEGFGGEVVDLERLAGPL